MCGREEDGAGVPQMDAAQKARCDEWLGRLGQWTGPRGQDMRAGLACEVVRGIVDVDSLEYLAGVEWAGGEPTADDFSKALVMYGRERQPVPGVDRAAMLAHGARQRDRRLVRELL